jgi:hypothetical protein
VPFIWRPGSHSSLAHASDEVHAGVFITITISSTMVLAVLDSQGAQSCIDATGRPAEAGGSGSLHLTWIDVYIQGRMSRLELKCSIKSGGEDDLSFETQVR